MALKLIIGNKNYSSWSLRPWIAMKVADIPFEETVISLNAPDFKAVVGPHSGTGKVPVLIDGDVRVWESLAILEYLAEKFPDRGLWPSDVAARALARVVANEMHAGFLPLRRLLPMNMWRPVIKRELTPEAAVNVKRLEAIWNDCRAQFGQGAKDSGPFLFGRYGACLLYTSLGADVDMLRQSVSSFAADRIAPRAAQIDRDNTFPRDLWPEMRCV